MLKNTCFYGHFEHLNSMVQGSFLASPLLLHKERTHESNHLSSRNLINQTSCLSTRVRGSYGTLFRRWCYFIRNRRNPFRNPEYLTQVLICFVSCSTNVSRVNGCQEVRILYLRRAIEFAIEQESDFQPQNYMLKFPLISFCYSSFKSPFTNLSPESEVSITCHGLLCHLLHDPKAPNTKCMGGFATPY